jgi:HSP20 family protein
MFDNVFQGFGVPSLTTSERSLPWPNVELGETDTDIQVIAELPGMEENDLDITVEEGVLTLRGEKKAEVEDKDRGYTERSYGRFERRIGLPRGIEQDKASATFRNGVLTITLPRSEAANENVRRIPIKTQAA